MLLRHHLLHRLIHHLLDVLHVLYVLYLLLVVPLVATLLLLIHPAAKGSQNHLLGGLRRIDSHQRSCLETADPPEPLWTIASSSWRRRAARLDPKVALTRHMDSLAASAVGAFACRNEVGAEYKVALVLRHHPVPLLPVSRLHVRVSEGYRLARLNLVARDL